MRPPRPDIAIPPIPARLDWVGEPVDSIDRVAAMGPVLVHFFDLAQLNSVRMLPYVRAWHERYDGDGLAMIAVHSPRFPFTQDASVVADAAERLGIDWPVAVDREFAVWRLYEPHGWPALFLWARGGALAWYHLGEGDYAGTEEAIREALADSGAEREWPPLIEPIRLSDAAGAQVVAPTPEQFPGGSTEEPWTSAEGDSPLRLDYEAGGAYAAADGEGEIRLRLDGKPLEPIRVSHPGLQELTVHERSERHTLELEPSPRVRLYSLQFAAGVP
ncbi:MAG: hypothetical protein ACJ75Z_10140 [Solirubrobacterales bacterium]